MFNFVNNTDQEVEKKLALEQRGNFQIFSASTSKQFQKTLNRKTISPFRKELPKSPFQNTKIR